MSELRTNRIIPRDGLPSGSYGGIIQVKTASAQDNTDYSSTSDTTMLTLSFTPQRADSVLWIHVEFGGIRSRITSNNSCLLYTSPSPRDGLLSRMPSSA